VTEQPPGPQVFDTADGLAHAFYELGGTGEPPIIIQHGFSATTFHEWIAPGIAGRLVEALGRRLIGLDARGHGASTRSHHPSDYGEGSMAADVSALADRLGLESFDFVGYSMGGVIGLEVARIDPRLRRLVIAGIGEGVIECGGVDTRVLDRAVLAEGLRAEDASSYPALVQAFRGGIEQMGNDRLALAAHAASPRHIASGLDRIRRPVLLIAGDNDPLAIHPERLAAAIPGCRLAIVPGDHVSARLSPEFTTVTIEFLR
jgi:pimeloyl-ACP methyl ester carboxylesterase